ncbi:MAG: SIS domain-containing protein [Pseudobdellovibrionaceae bacterium]
MKQSAVERARKVLDIEAQAILALRDRLNETFEKAVDVIEKCQGKVIVTGIGKSGQIGRKIASTFSSTGTPAVFLHPAESSHGDLGVIGQGDVVLALSYGGESPELNALLKHLARKGNPLIAMTGVLKSSLAQSAQVVLDVSVAKEACPLELAPTASSTATLAMGDALAMAMMERKGFSAEQFAEFHPGGNLGFKLSRVSDNMHTGAGFVLVSEDTPLRKVFSLMSQKETRGAAGIVSSGGDLLGIITDGDIRRRLENSPDPLAGAAKDMMTKTPRTVDANEIAEKALFMMEQFRISLLFVLDSNSAHPKKPVGVIHIHDLLRNKVR